MSTIVIAMLPELGHFNATLKLTRSLHLRGHQVFYLIGSDYAAYTRAQELNFISFDAGLKHDQSVSQLDVMEYLLEAKIHGHAQSVAFRQATHKLTGALSVLAWSTTTD
ncbi:MAG TPA: hypothetical protein VLB46_20915 [Pyrinomonadaceae bacterium]|nr:hypothetical protein [Pyrinomonadaceae bacterium]